MAANTPATLLRGASASFLVRLGAAGIGFLGQILLARLLGVSAYGEYIFVISWVVVLSLVARIGLDAAGVRFVASYRSTGDWSRLHGFLVTSRRLVAVASVAVAGVAALAIWTWRGQITPSLRHTGWIACLLLPVFGLLHFEASCLRALKRVVAAQLPIEAIRPGLVALGVGGLYLLTGLDLSASTAMAAQLAASLVALGLTAVFLRRYLDRQVAEAGPVVEIRAWLAVALPLLLIAGSHVLLSQTDIIMLGALVDTDASGIYAAASRLVVLVPFGLMAVNSMAAPMIAELWAQGDRRELQRLLNVSARAILLATTPLAIGLAVLGPFVLGLFGEQFKASYPALLILIAGQVVNAGVGSVGYLMTMTHLERAAALIIAIVAALNVLLNAGLIPLWGLEGAATATAVSTACWNLAMLAAVRRRLRLNPTVLPLSTRAE